MYIKSKVVRNTYIVVKYLRLPKKKSHMRLVYKTIMAVRLGLHAKWSIYFIRKICSVGMEISVRIYLKLTCDVIIFILSPKLYNNDTFYPKLL